MTEKLKELSLSKDSIVPISVGLLILIFGALSTGVWALAMRVHDWETKLTAVERRMGSRWSYFMELDSWKEYKRLNPESKVPDVKTIREDYRSMFP